MRGYMVNAKYFIILVVTVVCCTGCANKRFYFGIDDYGETKTYSSAWETQHEDAVSERRGRK